MAAITGAIVAAVGVTASVVSSESASKRAANALSSSTSTALAEQRRQFDLTREDFSGFIGRADEAGERLQSFLGLRGSEAEQAALAGFEESPGQAFLRERQERSLLRNEAAIGGLGGGNVRTALQEQAFGIASQQLGERKSRLAQVAGLGAGVSQTGAAVGAGISGNISALLQQAGINQSQSILALDASRQSGLSRIAGAFTGKGGFTEAFGSGRRE